MTERLEVPGDIRTHLVDICGALPDVIEEAAWVGQRWRVRTKTFAHVLPVGADWPPAYVSALGTREPAIVLTFRSCGEELGTLRSSGLPFFAPPWHPATVGMVVDEQTDWDEVEELLVESYCAVAPKKLADQVVRPPI